MDIYLDFDGTVVEHAYPAIGKENDGALETIKMLKNAGHNIFLNTARVDISNYTLLLALDWFEKHSYFKILPFYAICKTKIMPEIWNLNIAKKTGRLFIDDVAYNIPLKPSIMVKGSMVDWHKVRKQLKEHGII